MTADSIGVHLQLKYEKILTEPLPESMTALLLQLAESRNRRGA